MLSRPHGDALLNQERPDLIDRGGPACNQPRPNTMQCLQIQLILTFFSNRAEVWPHCCFCDSFRIVVIVLLPLVERLHIDRRDDPRLKPELSQHSIYKMRAHAGLHSNDTTGQILERRLQRQTLDLLSLIAMTRVVKADAVKRVFCDVDANDSNLTDVFWLS